MPMIHARHIPHVTHIGFLEKPLSERQPDFDGPGISVSTDPGAWRSIKGLNAPEWELSYTAAHWVDAMSFTQEDRTDIENWMVMKRYMRKVTAWEVMYFEEEASEFVDKVLESREEAARLAGRSLAEEIAASADGHGATMQTETYRLEKRAIRRLGGWPDALSWHEAAILLYTREVVLPKRPFVVGVWWEEPTSIEHGTAPAGILFPERLPLFEVEDEGGEVLPFCAAFPEFEIPEDEPEMTEALRRMVANMRKQEKELIEAGIDPRDALRQVLD